jgi:sterol desaturase/sphingolipid hydroxylase (fatty acid hydroxylase superfamily)
LKSARPSAWLLTISLTRWNYVLSIAADAAVSVGMLGWSMATMDRPRAILPITVCALLGYTLTEYSWHRFLFHWNRAPQSMREGHARHHGSPQKPLALPFFTAVPHAIVVWGLAASVTDASLGALFTGVWFLGYVAYSGLHHLMHADARYAVLDWLRAVHDVHHSRPTRNFGVTTPLWDFVFGTWTPPKHS